MRPFSSVTLINCPRPDASPALSFKRRFSSCRTYLNKSFAVNLSIFTKPTAARNSGFMREVDGKTVVLQDHDHKRRKDYIIEDPELIRQVQARIVRRIVPEVLKVYSFKATRMERYIVSCYSAEDSGHFRAHRDNTTKGTAHRRFAVSINLNAEFEGGEIGFPEYGSRGFKPHQAERLFFPAHCFTLFRRSRAAAATHFCPFFMMKRRPKFARPTTNSSVMASRSTTQVKKMS